MDAILYWNQIALKTVAQDSTGMPPKADQGGPTRTSRALAIVHLAMYDALNSIAQIYQPYVSGLPTPPAGASIDAAIGEAACVTLSALYPSQRARFLAVSQDWLAGLVDSTQAIEDGRVQGKHVAERLLNQRASDGSANSLPYCPSQEPGKHRADPLDPHQSFLTPNWGKVTPFGISNFLAAPPPPLNSSRYETDFNDVKEKGALIGSTRTPEEVTIGLFWAYDGAQQIGTPPRLYNQIVRTIAQQKGNSLAENARLFALVNMAMADAGIQCWYSKYFYEIWRPVVGIREADPGWGPTCKGDGNPATKGDPYWLPLGAPKTNEVGQRNFTPPFPAYPSGHATFGAASLDMVRLVYGDDAIAFELVSDELNGKNLDSDGSVRTRHCRPFSRLSDAIAENGRSRVFLGVHWQFDADAGIESGKQIAEQIYSNFLQPL